MFGIAPGDRVILELAEMAREGDVLGPRDVLIAEEEHAVSEQQRTDLHHQFRRSCRGAEIHVGNLGADCASQKFGDGFHIGTVISAERVLPAGALWADSRFAC